MSRAPADQVETLGRYRLLEPIARGGMAEVFKAKSFGVEGFEKILVVKRIVPELAASATFVEMFIQEAKLAVQLSHANIVQVFDLGRIAATADAPPSYFIAMEYVAGVDLSTLLKHYRKHKTVLPIGMAVFLVGEVAKALDHAHRSHDAEGQPLGIVHRDISPHNILVSWDGEVKVTDFGIAKAARALPPRSDALGAGRVTGKISFMSPEQSRSEPADARSDLFSLGTVLYELLSGANPFSAPTTSETLRRIQASEYPPLSLIRNDLPAALVRIVDELLRADPQERTASAAELNEQLVGYRYTAGDRSGAADLSQLLAPLRAEAEQPDVALSAMLEDPHTADDCTPVEVPHPSAPPPPVSKPGAGERREVTLMAVSMNGAHGVADAEAIRDLLEQHGAWIEEHSAAQVVAIFGLGATDGRDGQAAVRAGLALMRHHQPGRATSVGVHSGPISLDDGGIPIADERLTSLLSTAQSLTRATGRQVALSPTTARLVRRSFATEPITRGNQSPAEGFVVRGALLPDGPGSRFSGRTKELKRLGQILAQATRKTPQLAIIRAETGMGKSRFLREARRRLERGRFNVAFYVTRCPLNGASIPWSGLRAMLHVLCGTQPDDDPRRIMEVRPRLRALGLRDEHSAAVLNLLGAQVQSVDRELRVILRTSFERMVTSLCRDRLHCFAWDDAQAIDRESLDTVLRLLKRRARPSSPEQGPQELPENDLRAVFILSQRGEIPPTLTKRPEYHRIELGELGEYETRKLLESRLGAKAVPPRLLEHVRSCAGGHPLFIEELMRELCDTGFVQVLNGKVTVRPDTQSSPPRTLRTLVADRVGRLQQRERKVLQALAIIGEPASSPLLCRVLDQSLPTLDRHLASLADKGLLRRRGPSQAGFASPLYQEIVLDAMATSTRKQLHLLASEVYLQSHLPGAGDAANFAAEHLLGAGQREAAVDQFWRAAEEKLAADKLEGALRAMLRGLDLADVKTRQVEQLCQWLAKIAATVSKVRQGASLAQTVQLALREIDARGDQRQRAAANIHAARALGSINLFEEAYEALSRAGAEQLTDTALLRESLTTEAIISSRHGDFVRTIEAGERLERLGLVQDNPDALMTLALARAMSGQPDAGLALMAEVEARGAPKDVVEAVTRAKHRVLIHLNRRDYETAAREATQLAALAQATGLRFDAAAAQHNLGDIYDRLGDHPRAYAAFVASLELTKLLEHDRLANLNQMHLCLLDGLRSPGDTQERLKALIRYADSRDWLWDVLEGKYLLARLLTSLGDHAGARTTLEALIEESAAHSHELIRSDAEMLLQDLGTIH